MSFKILVISHTRRKINIRVLSIISRKINTTSFFLIDLFICLGIKPLLMLSTKLVLFLEKNYLLDFLLRFRTFQVSEFSVFRINTKVSILPSDDKSF